TGILTKTTALRFVRPGTSPVESGQLEDIFITSDPRTNKLLVSASEKSMRLVEALIQELDVPPSAQARVNVFRLRNSDAATIATTLQQLFLGTTTGAGGFGGGGFGGGGFGGGGALGAAAQAAQALAPISLSGLSPEGIPLIALRITVDTR